MTAQEAVDATKVVEDAGIVTSVGFNYVRNPIQQYVKELIASGELGEVVNFRGMYDQDYYNDPEQKHEWRMFKSASASGALGDLASHTLSLSQYLIGDIAEVCGMTKIIVPERPDPRTPPACCRSKTTTLCSSCSTLQTVRAARFSPTVWRPAAKCRSAMKFS